MKLDESINKITDYIKEMTDAEIQVCNEMEDLYEVIHKSESIIGTNSTFKYFCRGSICTHRYIEFFEDDYKDYDIHKGEVTLSLEGYSIPYLYIHYDDSYCKVYFPDDILFKSADEMKDFVKENTAKYNAIADAKAKELKEKLKQNEEYQQYLKLKKKFEQGVN